VFPIAFIVCGLNIQRNDADILMAARTQLGGRMQDLPRRKTSLAVGLWPTLRWSRTMSSSPF